MVPYGTRQPLEGGTAQPFPPSPIDGLGRRSEPASRACLDLTEGNGAASNHDHVDLPRATAPVADRDEIAVSAIVECGDTLAPEAEARWRTLARFVHPRDPACRDIVGR